MPSPLLLFSFFNLPSAMGLSIGIRPVPKVDRSKFHPSTHYYHTHENGNEFETPVLVENALSKNKCELICDAIVQESGDCVVDVQRKTKVMDEEEEWTQTSIVPCELARALDFMMESRHDDSFFCFCEGLLDGEVKGNLDKVREVLRYAKEGLFGGSDGDDGRRDLFHYFPDHVKPSDCVVLAGEGATSTLHRDPYTWTGTSLCLEGTKIWRFIAPPGAMASEHASESGVSCVDNALQSYRLPSVAWEDGVHLSSGWQSDLSLFEGRREDVPSAEEFAMLEEEDLERKIRDLDDMAQNLDRLTPSSDFPDEMPTEIWTVVQKPGDMLIIPAFWWHQTYAPEPSLAIASQRAGLERDAGRVVRHILDMVHYDDCDDYDDLPEVLKKRRYDLCEDTPRDIAQSLFAVLSEI